MKRTEWVFDFVLVEGLRGKRLKYIYSHLCQTTQVQSPKIYMFFIPLMIQKF